MGLAGLWHGASWTFLVWGLAHGLGLAIHRAYGDSALQKWIISVLPPRIYLLLMVILTFHFVMLFWVLFRSPDFATVWHIYGKLATLFWQNSAWEFDQAYLFKSFGFTAMAVYGIYLLAMRSTTISTMVGTSLRRRVIGYALVFYLVLLLTPVHTEPFIYFQF